MFIFLSQIGLSSVYFEPYLYTLRIRAQLIFWFWGYRCSPFFLKQIWYNWKACCLSSKIIQNLIYFKNRHTVSFVTNVTNAVKREHFVLNFDFISWWELYCIFKDCCLGFVYLSLLVSADVPDLFTSTWLAFWDLLLLLLGFEISIRCDTPLAFPSCGQKIGAIMFKKGLSSNIFLNRTTIRNKEQGSYYIV